MSASDNVNLLAGPQLLGILFDWGLQGVLTVQICKCLNPTTTNSLTAFPQPDLYHIYFPGDRLMLKCLVYGMAIFATVQTGLITAYAFDIYVYNNGNVASMMATHDAWFAVPVMSAMVSCTAQIYFAWRIWVLARSHVLAGIIIVLSLVQAGAGFATGIKVSSGVVASIPHSTKVNCDFRERYKNNMTYELNYCLLQENNAADLHALVGNGALILVDVKPYLCHDLGSSDWETQTNDAGGVRLGLTEVMLVCAQHADAAPGVVDSDVSISGM
ncbi:predicted protein [Postia placenta Mad-698-R]|nr:predicted protein [Postia placenta Mad-698-R]